MTTALEKEVAKAPKSTQKTISKIIKAGEQQGYFILKSSILCLDDN